jgi:hypothetical protein
MPPDAVMIIIRTSDILPDFCAGPFGVGIIGGLIPDRDVEAADRGINRAPESPHFRPEDGNELG